MRTSTVNFWVDALALVGFVGVLSTGALLRGFPVELADYAILGVRRHDWADLHWVLSLLFLALVAIHLLLHWRWVKVNATERLKLGPRALAVVLAAATLGLCVVLPAYLTKDLPSRRAAREMRRGASTPQGQRGARPQLPDPAIYRQ